jgi:DNA-binding response OmpR family regulator
MPQHILLCDDEPHILGAARYKLAAAGYEVECAADGEEGWQAMCRRRPDLLITDCNMPRLSGLELLERMRATPALAALPAIMLTAKGLELSRDELRERLKVFALVGKPFSPRELLRLVQDALAAAAQAVVPGDAQLAEAAGTAAVLPACGQIPTDAGPRFSQGSLP